MAEAPFIVKALLVGAIGITLAVGAYGCARLIANMRREVEFIPPERREFDWNESSQSLSYGDSEIERKRRAERLQDKQPRKRTG